MVLGHDGLKVLDFGLARVWLPDEPAAPDAFDTDLVRPGAVVGTAAYMSPEQDRAW
jgi:serine/threonine protein kinase